MSGKNCPLTAILFAAIFLFAALCLPLTVDAKPVSKLSEMWVLNQKSDMGDAMVYVLPDAVRIDDLTHNYSMLCKAPLWQVSMFRRGDKIVYEESLKDWLKIGSAWYTGSDIRRLPNKTIGPATRTSLNDIPCLTTQIPDSVIEKAAPNMMARDRVKSKTVTGYVYYLFDNIKTSIEVAQFLQKRHYLPKSPYVPIGLKTMYADAPPAVNFLTVSAAKAKLRPELFDYPKNFRKIDSEWTIILGKNKDASMSDWMKDLDLGSRFGKEPQKRSQP